MLEADPELGLFLPCNVIVYETADGTHVSAVDPEAMLGLSGNQDLAQHRGRGQGAPPRAEQRFETIGRAGRRRKETTS